jgi:hypothetical protein
MAPIGFITSRRSNHLFTERVLKVELNACPNPMKTQIALALDGNARNRILASEVESIKEFVLVQPLR